MADISQGLKDELVATLAAVDASLDTLKNKVLQARPIVTSTVQIGGQDYAAEVIEAADGTLTIIIKGVPKEEAE